MYIFGTVRLASAEKAHTDTIAQVVHDARLYAFVYNIYMMCDRSCVCCRDTCVRHRLYSLAYNLHKFLIRYKEITHTEGG